MADFSRSTDYSSDASANIQSVHFGALSAVTESELNESQFLVSDRLRNVIKILIGDGIIGQGNVSYINGVYTISNEIAFANGIYIPISTLTLSGLTEGSKIYLDTWQKELTHTDTIKAKGNQQETNTVPNTIMDDRYNVETSRRYQICHTLSTTNSDSSHYYVLLGTIVGTDFGTTLEEPPLITRGKTNLISQIKPAMTWNDLAGIGDHRP